MPCTCWKWKAAEAAEAVAAALIVLAPPAGAATLPCALGTPKVETSGGVARIEIGVDCTPGAAGARNFPAGTNLLVGLTIYGPALESVELRNRDDNFARRVLEARPDIAAALERATQSRGVLVAGAPRWIVLGDDAAASVDITAQPLRIDKAGSRTTLRFEVPEATIAGKNHLLFAVWPASARQPCKKTSKFARSGCRRDGYVLDGEPVAAYPGREVNEFVHPRGDEWTSERWIVERFR